MTAVNPSASTLQAACASRCVATARRRPTSGPVVRFADLEVNIARRICARRKLHLTPIEFRLLAALLNNPGKVRPAPAAESVWGPNAVEHSHYLRIIWSPAALEADPARPQHLLTETGIGYRFMPEPRLYGTRGWRFSALQREAAKPASRIMKCLTPAA